MNVTRKLLSELQRPERNVRMHTDKQLKEFRRSVEMFGQIRPIVVDEAGTILAGNGLYETLIQMGVAEADCYVVTGLTEAQKKKLMLADNRIFNLGVDDLSVLDEFVFELKDDLDIPGYDEDLLQAMVMEADKAAEVLSEYGLLDEEKVEEIRENQADIQAQEERISQKPVFNAADPQEEIQSISQQKFVTCPKCGERIWL